MMPRFAEIFDDYGTNRQQGTHKSEVTGDKDNRSLMEPSMIGHR
jgi:hypothetical protein